MSWDEWSHQKTKLARLHELASDDPIEEAVCDDIYEYVERLSDLSDVSYH